MRNDRDRAGARPGRLSEEEIDLSGNQWMEDDNNWMSGDSGVIIRDERVNEPWECRDGVGGGGGGETYSWKIDPDPDATEADSPKN